MVNKVLQFVNEKEMLLPGDRVIVGVSGGADSVCLLDLLVQIKNIVPIDIFVVHVEHGIRGQDSLNDARFVEQLAANYHLQFHKFSFDVKKEAKLAKLGVEEMARILRYQAFHAALSEFHCNKIAVAHNKNDNAETLLLNLFRGSGLKGLGGIAPVREQVIRPLLCMERSEIENYLAQRNILYCTDQTNFEEDYTRNKIRLTVISYVTDHINQQAVTHMDAASRMIYEAWEYLESETDKVYQECVIQKDKVYQIQISKLLCVSDVLKKNIIRKCIGNSQSSLKDITSGHVEQVFGLMTQQSGKQISLPYGQTARRSYDQIIIEANEILQNQVKKSIPITVPGIYCFEELRMEFSLEQREQNQIIPENIYTKWFDYDKIGNDLRLRMRESKDYIVVNKKGGTKKLKDYFIDQKIDREKRDSIPLLCSQNHVIWIVGYRISEAYKIDEFTKRVLKVEVNGGKNDD